MNYVGDSNCVFMHINDWYIYGTYGGASWGDIFWRPKNNKVMMDDGVSFII